MDITKFNYVTINKNRGWRGLSEVVIKNKEGKELMSAVFSFSPDVWDDLIINHTMVVQDDNFYYVLKFNEKDCDIDLPKPRQQRSVLIKCAVLKIEEVTPIDKKTWAGKNETSFNSKCITHFLSNKNNHTISDWNYIGVRVIPTI